MRDRLLSGHRLLGFRLLIPIRCDLRRLALLTLEEIVRVFALSHFVVVTAVSDQQVGSLLGEQLRQCLGMPAACIVPVINEIDLPGTSTVGQTAQCTGGVIGRVSA